MLATMRDENASLRSRVTELEAEIVERNKLTDYAAAALTRAVDRAAQLTDVLKAHHAPHHCCFIEQCVAAGTHLP